MLRFIGVLVLITAAGALIRGCYDSPLKDIVKD